MHAPIDSVNADDLVIGLVQIPPGQTSQELLDTSDPKIEKFLKKFFKRMNKKPNTTFGKAIPKIFNDNVTFELMLKDETFSHVPFIGKSSDSSWCLRQFPTYRMTIQPTKIIDELDNEVDFVEDDNITDITANVSKRYQESDLRLLVLSDEEDCLEIVSSKKRRC